jgi:hypothetical protein
MGYIIRTEADGAHVKKWGNLDRGRIRGVARQGVKFEQSGQTARRCAAANVQEIPRPVGETGSPRYDETPLVTPGRQQPVPCHRVLGAVYEPAQRCRSRPDAGAGMPDADTASLERSASMAQSAGWVSCSRFGTLHDGGFQLIEGPISPMRCTGGPRLRLSGPAAARGRRRNPLPNSARPWRTTRPASLIAQRTSQLPVPTGSLALRDMEASK